MLSRWRGAITGLSALFLLMVWAQPSHAQTAPIKAEVDRTELSTDEILTFTVTLTGSNGLPAPSLPDLKGLDIVGRSTTSKMSIINGKASAEVVHWYNLRPTQAGSVTIGSVSVTINGQTFYTGPITLDVTQASASYRQPPSASPPEDTATKLSGQDYFVEAEVSNTSPYLGQQLIYTFRFYRAVRIFHQPRYDAPVFTGFWDNQEIEQRHYRTQAANRSYRVTELRTILFPTIVGPKTIGSGSMTVRRGFLERDRELWSTSISLEVSPLPNGAPADFSGAVGQFTIKADIDSSTGNVNEPLTLTVTISGEGNIDTLADPTWPDMSRLRAFDSTSTATTEVSDMKVVGSRVYERILVPGAAGDFTIPSISYTYFDPSEGKYRAVATDPIKVSVSPRATEAPIPALPDPVREEVERLAADIRHIKPAPAALSSPGRPLTEHGVYWAAWALPLLALGAGVGWTLRRRRLTGDTALARSLNAYNEATRLLAQARHTVADSYGDAGRILTTYIGDKLSQPASGMTQSTLAHLLAEHGVDTTVIERVEQCLIASEGGRFAPGIGPSGDGERLLDKTEAIISDLERELGA